MLDLQPQVDPERSTLRLCSKVGLGCMVVICVLIAAQAVTGALLAVRSALSRPASGDDLIRAVELCALVRSVHAFAGQAALIPAFTVLTLSILFMFNVGSFDTRHTRFTWAQVMRALLLCCILLGIAFGGRLYGDYLRSEGFWLSGDPESAAEAPCATIGAVGSTGFYTFVGLHGIVLPFLAIISIIFMWPAFYEFAVRKGPAAYTKWTEFKKAMHTDTRPAENLPEGWSAMSRMAERRRMEEDE